jgi:hypothetical protein
MAFSTMSLSGPVSNLRLRSRGTKVYGVLRNSPVKAATSTGNRIHPISRRIVAITENRNSQFSMHRAIQINQFRKALSISAGFLRIAHRPHSAAGSASRACGSWIDDCEIIQGPRANSTHTAVISVRALPSSNRVENPRPGGEKGLR